LPDVAPPARPVAASAGILERLATISDGLDSINPFASSGPKMAPLHRRSTRRMTVRDVWSARSARRETTPSRRLWSAMSVYAASAKGTAEPDRGWQARSGRSMLAKALSAGVGANGKLVVVATAEG
jgi:outer membrane protein assembly factor BamB